MHYLWCQYHKEQMNNYAIPNIDKQQLAIPTIRIKAIWSIGTVAELIGVHSNFFKIGSSYLLYEV